MDLFCDSVGTVTIIINYENDCPMRMIQLELLQVTLISNDNPDK